MLQYLNQQVAPAARLTGQRVILQNVSRRAFLKGTASGVGLVVAMQLVPFNAAGAFEQYPTGGLDMPNGIVTDPHVFVSIDPDGTVTIVAHRSEMGTGARTSLPMVVADELEADWARVKIVQAPGDEPKYGNQDTDGSRSMRHHIQPMRQIGASVRQHARAGGGQGVGRRCGALPGAEPRSHPSGEGRRRHGRDRPAARLRRPRRGGDGLAGPGVREPQVQGRERVPLHRQGRGADLRPARHHDRQGDLRRRRQPARAEVCGDRAPAGGRGQGQVRGQLGGAGHTGRREGRGAPGQHAAREVRAARRRRGDRQPTPGPRSRGATRCRSSGKTARTAPTIPSSTTRRCRPRRRNPAR